MKAKPASHPTSNFIDKESVNLIESLLAKHGRVMPSIASIDKWPNIDGRVEVQDEHNNLIGPLSVQVKTLALNHRLKYDCKVDFLAYCEEIEPCLLLAVDRQVQRVYWLYFDAQSLKEISYKSNRHTKTIYFKESQYFDENTKSYIEEWAKIIEVNKQRLHSYDDLKIKNNLLERLLKSANKAAGTSNSSFATMHLFLDQLNSRFDNDFPIVKKVFYPYSWKLGIAYASYEPRKLEYILFPIPFDKNDVLIKEIDSELFEEMMAKGLTFSYYPRTNPIQDHPSKHAKEIVQSKTLQLVKMRLLSHSGHEFLAQEYVIAFIDKFHEQLGLLEKDEYSLTEVEFGFYRHLPLWVEEAYGLLLRKRPNNIVAQIMRDGYFDPDILRQLGTEDRQEIQQIVSKRLGKEPRPIHIGNKTLNMVIFSDLFNYLKQFNISITRIYKKPNYSRFRGGSSWIWNVYSKDDAEYNSKLVFESLQEAYATIVSNNFPTLKNDLDLFNGADRILVYCTVREEYQGFVTAPNYHMYYIKDQNPSRAKTVEIINEQQARALKDLLQPQSANKWGVGKNFRIFAHSSSSLDFIYEETPLLNLIYEILKPKLDEYFAKYHIPQI